MIVVINELEIKMNGNADMFDITNMIKAEINKSAVKNGIVTLFIPGATAGVTTIEYEEGLIEDFKNLWEDIAPTEKRYAHNIRWGDGNGHSHVRASLLGSSLSVPVKDGVMTLGTWQQIVIVDFDNRPRIRKFICQVMGEQIQ